jgi:hypothetical protein
MKVMRRSRWLARLAAMLVVGVAGLVVAAQAPAQAGIVFQSHVVASWGFNNEGDLGGNELASIVTLRAGGRASGTPRRSGSAGR